MTHVKWQHHTCESKNHLVLYHKNQNLIFFSLDEWEKLEFLGAIVRVKAQTPVYWAMGLIQGS